MRWIARLSAATPRRRRSPRPGLYHFRVVISRRHRARGRRTGPTYSRRWTMYGLETLYPQPSTPQLRWRKSLLIASHIWALPDSVHVSSEASAALWPLVVGLYIRTP